jgi:hypothetical protein
VNPSVYSPFKRSGYDYFYDLTEGSNGNYRRILPTAKSGILLVEAAKDQNK